MDPSAAQTPFGFIEIPPNRVTELKNVACVYCGIELNESNRSREHVIERRLVPKGKFDGQCNLIVKACRACNARKSDLENDISAITLQPDLHGEYAHDDAEAMKDAQRKARNSHSRRTRKPVQDSHEHLMLDGSLGPGINISFGLTSQHKSTKIGPSNSRASN